MCVYCLVMVLCVCVRVCVYIVHAIVFIEILLHYNIVFPGSVLETNHWFAFFVDKFATIELLKICVKSRPSSRSGFFLCKPLAFLIIVCGCRNPSFKAP